MIETQETQITPSTVLSDVNSDLRSPTFAAKYLGTNTGTLAIWRSTRRYPLRYVRIGRRIMYRLSDLEEFIGLRTESGVGESKPRPRNRRAA